MDRTRERVLHYIIEYKKAHNGNSPTYQEIANQLELKSKSVVAYHIAILCTQGYLKHPEGGRRQLEVVKQDDN